MCAAWTGGGRIGGTADVRAALERVNRAAHTRGNLALVTQPVTTGDQIELSGDISEVLPADPRLRPLLPWPGGLRKGATVAAVGSASLLMLMLAGAMRGTGSWAAVVGMPSFGALAAAELGVPLDRLGLIRDAGPDWPTIVATLIDGVDLVVVQPPAASAEGLLRSLSARARQKGAVLIAARPWAGADLTLQVTGRRWHGLRAGRGRLRYCELEVTAAGRGRAVRARTATVPLPDPPGPPPVIPPAPDRSAGTEAPLSDLWANPQSSSPPPPAPWADTKEQVATRVKRTAVWTADLVRAVR